MRWPNLWGFMTTQTEQSTKILIPVEVASSIIIIVQKMRDKRHYCKSLV